MSFFLKQDQIDKLKNSYILPDFYGAEMVTVVFETSAEVVQQVLPKPLSPTPDPTAFAFVARYPKTNFGCVYNEGALLLSCTYKGEHGWFCLSMPVDDDMALIGGREQFGFPKKLAEITLDRDGDSVVGSVTRKGTEILRIECTLTGEAPANLMHDMLPATTDWEGVPCYNVVNFLIKHFPSPDGFGLDFLPRVVREPVLFRPLELQTGQGTLKMQWTPSDPLGDIPVNKIRRMFYGTYNNTMLPGKVVGRVWRPFQFIKHAFFKTDFHWTVLKRFDASQTARVQEIQRKAKQY